MTGLIRTAVALDPELDLRSVDPLLDDPGIQVLDILEGESWGAEELNDADVLLIASTGHGESPLRLIAKAVRERPDRPIVVACVGPANGLVRQVFESGADDIVLLADSMEPGADTFFALQKAVARRNGANATPTEASGALICVLGPKGGTGKTLTSVNLSLALADAGQRTTVVDLDLQFGDVGLAMGLRPDRTIYDLATSGGVLDADKVGAYLIEHESGARALLAPTRPDQASAITVEFLKDLYSVLRTMGDFVVVDTPPAFTPEVITSVDVSSAVCMVGMLDAPSLKNTKLGLETLELMGYPRERTHVLLNRADATVGLTRDDVREVIGRDPDVLVPSQRDIVRSVNAGEPIVLSARRSEPAKAFRSLAARYIAERTTDAPAAAPRRSLRLRRRS
jgi:pilus assembly protein CpaE